MLSEVENEDATMYKSRRKLLQVDVTVIVGIAGASCKT